MSVFATFTPSFSMTEFSGAEEEKDARKFRTGKVSSTFLPLDIKGRRTNVYFLVRKQICFGFGVVVVRMMNVNE